MKRVLRVFSFFLLGVVSLVPGCQYILPLVNDAPVAYISSITPSGATEGEVVRFSGYGTDVDGQIVAYRWRSDRDGQIGTTAQFETTSLSVGPHVVFFMVQDNIGEWSEEVYATISILEYIPPPVTVNSFITSATTITKGDSVTLSWNVSNAASVSIDQGVGTVVHVGSVTVSPSSTTTYRLMAIGEGTSSGTAQVTVIVQDPAPMILFFGASPRSVMSGGSSRLTWQTTGATDVRILPQIGTVGPSGSVNVTLTGDQTYTFTLLATNGPNTVSAEVTIDSESPMPRTYQTTLDVVLSMSGYARDFGSPIYDTGDIWVGDDDDNSGIQGFVTFDISDIPDDAVIIDVFVDLSDYEDVLGDPFDDLDCLRAYTHNYGNLNGADYVDGGVGGSIGRWCSESEIDDPDGGLTSGFRNALQNRIGDNTFQIRFQFDTEETDSNNDFDLVQWSGSDVPRLTVQYYTFE
jgi:hypothetical protein